MNDAYLLTGGNIGNRAAYLREAMEAIGKACGPVVKHSAVYETAPWGMEDQSPFLNQVLHIQTGLDPYQLLDALLEIEQLAGRKRLLKYGPRVIDIDILFFNDAVIDTEGLRVPHPRLAERRFVLVPLQEIAPEKMHPVLHQPVRVLLARCTDPLAVHKFN